MGIQFFNSLTGDTHEFKSLDPGIVRMYSCGPTVYDFAHIGNFRSFLFADLLRRFLEVSGYRVHHVMNITDVGHMTDDQLADGGGEDKMEVAAARIKESKKSGKVDDGAVDNPDDPYQIAEFYLDAFLRDGRTLGLKVADEFPECMPRATEHIEGMQQMIKKLLDNGHAYIADDGVVYYSVESFPGYGQLSGNTLEKLRSGSGGRVLDEDQQNKRHPGDFLLWKADASHLMKWDSPWGTGYPGWHIECSMMAMKLFQCDVIDIHTGGEDLIFPHHECEIAQSCGASGEEKFSNFWMHARFLLVEGEKMSKSDGNFFTVRDVLEGKVTGREVHPAVLRYELIKSHYRSNMNFTKKGLLDSANVVRRLSEFVQRLTEESGGKEVEIDNSHPVLKEFLDALSDDLNISEALGAVLPWCGTQQQDAAEALAVMRRINAVLNVAPLEGQGGDEPSSDADALDLDALCRQLDDARANKDYNTADQIREKLKNAGYEVRTTAEGTSVQKQLA